MPPHIITCPSLLKKADLKEEVQLQPHQQRVADLAKTKPIRMLMLHALGSGKSLTGIAAAEARGEPYTAVAPASLRPNYQGEISKFTTGNLPSNVMSYTELGKGVQPSNVGTVILDEAHRVRNPASGQGRQAQELARRAKQLILLTGTPLVNEPGDLAPLMSMLTQKKIAPKEFTQRYTTQQKIYPNLFRRLINSPTGEETVINKPEELKAMLRGHVDYYAPNHPVVPTQYEDVPVEMGVEQSRLYKAMWNQLPTLLRWKLQNDFPLSKAELARSLSFITGPRQVSLSTYPYLKEKDPHVAFGHSAKLQRAMSLLQEKLKDERSKALVFSNYIDAGLTPYAAALEKAGIPYGMFHGGLSDAQRRQLVNDYNQGRIRVALLGPSGTEGLSFKGTQLIQLLDPYWNPIRGHQSVGRGLRYDSHWNLPEELQKVHVQRFLSRLPMGFMDRLMSGVGMDRSRGTRGTDDYLTALAARKEKLNQQFLNLLREVGSEGKETK